MDQRIQALIKRSFRATLFFAAAVIVILLLLRQWRWAAGFTVGVIWSAVNFIFTLRILDVAVLKRPKKMLLLFLMVKFPLLYLAGLFILMSGYFPVMSILLGILPILLITGVLGIWLKRA